MPKRHAHSGLLFFGQNNAGFFLHVRKLCGYIAAIAFFRQFCRDALCNRIFGLEAAR
jgi:hypothetical protein